MHVAQVFLSNLFVLQKYSLRLNVISVCRLTQSPFFFVHSLTSIGNVLFFFLESCCDKLSDNSFCLRVREKLFLSQGNKQYRQFRSKTKTAMFIKDTKLFAQNISLIFVWFMRDSWHVRKFCVVRTHRQGNQYIQ